MDLTDVMTRLDEQGKGSARVVMGPLRALGKEVGKDHELALRLWETGRLDGRLLATMVMAPKSLTAEEAESLLASAGGSVQVLDELVYKVVAASKCADELRERWLGSDDALTVRAGWNLLVAQVLAKKVKAGDCGAILDAIDAKCKSAPVKVGESMMRCLVEIAVKFPEHRDRAMDIGARWGLLDDRPVPKGCTPYYAPAWIEAVLKRAKG